MAQPARLESAVERVATSPERVTFGTLALRQNAVW